MKNLFKIIFFVLILPVNAKAQPVTWSKWYDYNNYDNAGEDVKQTLDGGYIILGNTYQFSNYFSILIKTDNLGNLIWQKIIDYSVTNNDALSCFAVHQTKDSGFTISGYGRDSAVLIKTNKMGDIIWLKKYTKPGLAARFFDHKNTFDGGIIACGDLYPPFPSKLFFVKTNSAGAIEWSKIIDPNSNEIVNKIIQTCDSLFYFTGLNRIAKLNKYGNLIWSKDIQNTGSDLIEISSSSILLAGSNLQMFLTKIDTSGSVMWQKSYFPGSACNSMCLSIDNNILLSGYKDTLLAYYTAVSKTDTSGNEIFTKIIKSTPGNNFFIPWAVNCTNDYGFIFTGRTDFPGSVYRDNIFVIKSDSLCNAPDIVGINNYNSYNPQEFKLYQNYPNPFNPVTTIEYVLLKSGYVRLSIYDIKGSEICILVNSFVEDGMHKILFNAESIELASGMYFVKLSVTNSADLDSDGFIEIKKMVYLK